MHSLLAKKVRRGEITRERGEPMITLTLDLKTSAAILGTPKDKLLERLQRQEVEGICLDDDWRMSILSQ